MKKRVGIVGIGQTKYETSKANQLLDEVVFEAASKALQHAGITRDDVDNVVIAASDQIDGRPISSMMEAGPSGAYLKDEIKVTDEGSLAAILGYLRISSGLFDTALVTSWSKCSEGPVVLVTNLGADPFFHRFCALNYITAMGHQISAYKGKYNVNDLAASKVVVKNRKNAVNNSLACCREEVSEERVLSSKLVVWPLREMMIAPLCDGACSLVLASEEKAKAMTKNPIWIDGISWAIESYYLGERDLSRLTSLEVAARQAYKQAGIENPLLEIDVAEICDISAYHEIMAYEGLGFSNWGEGSKLVEQDVVKVGGKLPVNPSGGALSGMPFFANGLIRLAEAALQLRGEATGHQVDGSKTALAQGTYGFAGQGNSVFILRK